MNQELNKVYINQLLLAIRCVGFNKNNISGLVISIKYCNVKPINSNQRYSTKT